MHFYHVVTASCSNEHSFNADTQPFFVTYFSKSGPISMLNIAEILVQSRPVMIRHLFGQTFMEAELDNTISRSI